jgi:LuxR family maltose regulon positive regulatory protein
MNQRKSRRPDPHYYSDRLKRKLKEMLYLPATVVEAPSGYGKTTAIRDFLKTRLPEGAPVYWFTATEETPAAGFGRMCREINKIDSQAGERLLKIDFPNAVTVGEAADALRSIQCKNETYLVIDNFQFLQASLLPSFFTALIEHSGESLHIIVVTQMLKRNMIAAIAGRRVLRMTAADLRLDAGDIRKYYDLAGVSITPEEARNVERYTGGWIIAVYLQLCAFRETGTFTDTSAIPALIEHLVWEPLSEEQQMCLLRLSPFEVVTMRQACTLIGCETLPEYASTALESPFVQYVPGDGRYELHSILSGLLVQKRRERGAAFERECLLRAGDLCGEEGKTSEAFGFYAQVKDYERMLTLDLSHMILEDIGDTPFSELALDIAQNCPAEIKKRHILSMLRVAWTLLTAGMDEQFDRLMEELHAMLVTGNQGNDSCLLGEWTLLSSFKAYPRLDKMTTILRQAAVLFGYKSSQVILPTAPWWFGDYSPLAGFHIEPGRADQEADALEEYISLYARLTGGNGCGADALFRAELAYQRGDLNQAEVFAYKALTLAESRQQSIVQLGSTLLLGQIALHKADSAGWQYAINSMERAASFPSQNTFVTRSALDAVRGLLLSELKEQRSIAEWLQNSDFSGRKLPPFMFITVMFVHALYLLHQGEFARLIGTVQALVPDDAFFDRPYRDLFRSLALAVSHFYMSNHDLATALVEHAAERALPDGMVHPFVAFSSALQRMPDELIEKKYPLLFEKFKTVRERFETGWSSLRDDIFPDELPADLTPREYEVARLAAQGMRNSEIAEKLVVSESTVRTHMRIIFQKLDVDRRAKLAERLK